MLFSCSKNHFLDKKPNSDIITPSTLSDFQALLDNTGVMGVTPALGELSADNFYLDYSFWLPLDAKQHNAYIWAPDIFNGQGNVDDWNLPYQQVFYANVVLDGLPKMRPDSSNQQDWNALKGAALFMRAYAFYNVAQIFAPAYDSSSADMDLGIPLRLTPDINPVSKRATVKETYDQIEKDLRDAYKLLPTTPPSANRNRPSQPAVLAMLARMYLGMRAYKQAGNCADSCLQLYSTLMDYNLYSTSSVVPFTRLNDETIYQSSFFQTSGQVLRGILYPSVVVDSVLYASYESNDLRRQLFYKINGAGYPNINGSYGGSIYPFSGLATDEVYLIRAECRARAGDTDGALTDLNTLLKTRWMTGTYTAFMAGTAMEALDTILLERRKELAFRGLRWTDLRRLNKETGRSISLTRNLNGQTYSLAPNSPLYVLPIPPDVIAFSGMQQNLRPQP
jgi:hypothetical protein